MKHAIRIAAAEIVGVVVWFAVATVGDLVLRNAWPVYAAAEAGFAFTFAMLAARLALGAICSVAAGYLASWIAGARRGAGPVLSIALLVLFVPQHVRLWPAFPLWYHATFAATLLIVPTVGAWMRLAPRAPRHRAAEAVAAAPVR